MNSKKTPSLHTNIAPDTITGLCNPGFKGNNYEIHVKGQLSDIWADWFDGLTLDWLDDGEMVLSGYIVDQAALMGVLNKLSRLNLILLSVNEVTKEKEKK